MVINTPDLEKLKLRYEHFTDEQVAQLAHEPDGLTEAARDLLLAEVERRQMQVFCD